MSLTRFVQSDLWWSLAMAVNILLVFVRGVNLRTVRKWGWVYCVVCYGGPFGIALACLLITAPGKTAIYGDAGVRLSPFISAFHSRNLPCHLNVVLTTVWT